MKRATFVSTASGDSLCSDLLEKLTNFLCWEYTEYRCKKPGTNLWFYMWGLRPGTYSVFSGNPSNGDVTNVGYVTGGSKIEVIERDGTAVVSFFNENGTKNFTSIIAENENGGSVALNVNTEGDWYYMSDDFVSMMHYKIPLNKDPDASAAIIKMPDIYHGCAFKELYLMFSNPFPNTNAEFVIGTKRYQQLGAFSGGSLAIEITP